LSAEVKNIHEKARSDLQEPVDEFTGDLQSSAHDLESKITKIESLSKRFVTLRINCPMNGNAINPKRSKLL
jgi:hypothetical protein